MLDACIFSYNIKMKNLNRVKPKYWWYAIKKISGMVQISKPELFSTLQVDELEDQTITQIVNKINNNFLKLLKEFYPWKIRTKLLIQPQMLSQLLTCSLQMFKIF